MTETKTVELPLSKSEQRHLDNIRRRDEKRKKSKEKNQSKIERDAQLMALHEKYRPMIAKLEQEYRDSQQRVWDNWRKERSVS